MRIILKKVFQICCFFHLITFQVILELPVPCLLHIDREFKCNFLFHLPLFKHEEQELLRDTKQTNKQVIYISISISSFIYSYFILYPNKLN